VIDPGETKTVKLVARKSGVYPYYCTNFCSALHQEMQGYLEVVPLGQVMGLYRNNQGEMFATSQQKAAVAKRDVAQR
jgi:heme/copper-type cytochrome/quinol oxidase subunit 2